MSKLDLSTQLELQTLKKENVSLKNRLEHSKNIEDQLKGKIRNLEENVSGTSSIEKIALTEIKLLSNIRDEYQYEEIDELANDILKHGQLQPALISKDNFLLAGYRRYNAIKYLKENKELFPDIVIPHELIVYKVELTIADLTDEKIIEIQLAENEQRRAIDNFQLSKLFNKYIEKGYDQKYLSEKFKKAQPFVSAVINIKKIDDKLENLLKEIQIYGVTKKNITAVISSKFDKGIIGWKPLYEIAKQENIFEQKKAFLKLFKNRLTEEELNSQYFKEVNIKKENKKSFHGAIKQIKSFEKFINNISEDELQGKEEQVESLKKNIRKIENLLALIVKKD